MHPFNHPFIYPPMHASIHPFIHPYIHTFNNPSIHSSIHSVNSVLKVSSMIGATLSDRTVGKTNQPKTYSKKLIKKCVLSSLQSDNAVPWRGREEEKEVGAA